jgi:hypothetical protein
MQNAKNRIVYWKDCDKGIIVRYMRDNGLDFMDKEKKEWISCGPNSNYYREIFIGEGNNCLRSITKEEAQNILKQWGFLVSDE